MKLTETDLTMHIENYFKSQQAFVDQSLDAVEVDRPRRLRLIQTLVHNAYREGMTFAMGTALVTRAITGATDGDD